MAKLPKIGDRIPVEKLHVSALNVRAEEPFGEAEEDKQLIANLRRGKIIGPFKARPEGDGYGVIVGRRRFLAKKEAGAKYFVVGTDCLIEEMTDEEAREASLIENLDILRKTMNPITRAERLAEIIEFSPLGLRETARRLGISASTLSEWLKILELSPRMQEVVAKGLLGYTDALMVARMKLDEALQNELAEVVETKGVEAFKRELMRISEGKMKRGIPKAVYEVNRVVWDKRNRKEMSYYETLTKAAERKGMKVPEFIKDFLIRHIDEIEKELS
jgi:ParB family chromosome partitioning protein